MMDKKQIEALQNLAYAFEELINQMDKRAEAESDPKSGMMGFFKTQAKLGTTLKSISKGVKKIGEDTKKILSGQESLIQMSKEIKDAKEKKNIFARITDKDNKSKVKEGTKIIVLMAGAILAIGAAFKLVGQVDFVSVMALAFALPLVAIAFAKIAEQKELSGGQILKVLLTIVGISAAVALSSFFLSMVTPMSLPQFLTTIGIAGAFAVISFGIGELAKDMGRINLKELMMLPIAMVLIAGAITASSYILNLVQPIETDTLFSVVKLALALAVSSLVLLPSLYLLGKIPINAMLMGGLGLVVLAGAIMVSSLLLNLGTYGNYPGIGWAAGVGLSMLAFAIPMTVLGFIAISGVGALALLAGAVAVLGVAATIVGVSYILSAGTYDTYPGIGWSMGVGLSLVAFGTGMAMLGTIIVASFGLGAVALLAGSEAVKTVAQTIVDVSYILKRGTYKGGPTKEWSEGIGLAIGAFSPVYATLMKSQALSIFGSKAMTGDEYAGVMVSIGKSIIEVAKVFNKAGVSVWANAPTKQWAEGVGTAIGAFAPVFAAIDKGIGDRLMDAIFGEEDKVASMLQAMTAAAMGIITVGIIFSKSKVNYVGGPSKEWAEGVGGSIRAFAEVYAILEEEDIDDADDIKDLNNSLFAIIDSIKVVGSKFGDVKTQIMSPLDPNFMKDIRSNVEEFVALTKYLEENTISGVGAVAIVSHVKTILAIAKAYDTLGKSLTRLNSAITALKGNQLENVKMISQNILVINKDETGQDQIVSVPMPKGTTPTISQSTPSNTTQQSNTEMTSLLQEMNRKLGVIASNSTNLSSFVNELRSSGDVSLKH